MSGPLIRLRACARIVDAERVLLCQEDGDEFWTLPGGSVETGEFAREALVRELCEELGDRNFVVAAPFLVCENLFSWRSRAYQEVVLAFEADFADRTLAEAVVPFRGVEPHLTFSWTALAALPELDLRPSVLMPTILQPAGGPIVHECLREGFFD